MRLSQVLVVAAASFLFASETIAVTMDSNQAKISTAARGGPSQRLLRSYSKPVEDDSDDLDDLDERGGASELKSKPVEDDSKDLDDLEERGGTSELKSKPVEDDSDDLDDLEERVKTPELESLAKKWGHSFSDITSGNVMLNPKQLTSWQSTLNAGITAGKKLKIKDFNAAWRKKHGIGRRV